MQTGTGIIGIFLIRQKEGNYNYLVQVKYVLLS